MAIKSYDDFKIKKSDVDQYLYNVAEVVDGLRQFGLKINGQSLLDLKEKVKNDRFKVLVIGEFKNGKSTFINALMGEKILPAYSIPCTAVINEVIYGKEKKATLYFKNPLPSEISDNLEEKVIQHIKRNGSENVPPMIIDVNDLEKYVTIRDLCKEQSDAIKEVPYSKVILEYPIELCRNGIEIIDSPGLNEDGVRTKVTEEYLNKADAILFVLNCRKFAGKSEKDYIVDHIHKRGYKEIFFICTNIDVENDEKPRTNIINFGNTILSPLTELGKNGIFYVNSKDALAAKIDKNKGMLDKTGIPDFEYALSEYLRNNKGKAKLLSIIEPFLIYINSLSNDHICGYRAILNQDVEEYERRLRDGAPKLELAIQKKQVITNKIDLAMGDLTKQITKLMNIQYDKIINDIPEAVEKMDLDNKITINVFKQNKQKKALENEVIEKLKAFVQKEMSDWIKNDLNETIDGFIDNLEDELGSDIDIFYANLDEFRYEVSGIKKPKDISGFGRVSAAILGTIVGGPTYGMMGATLGFAETVKRSAITFGAAAVAGVILAFTPLGAAAIVTIANASLVIAGLIQALKSGESLVDKYKNEIKKGFIENFKEHKEEDSENYAKNLVKNVSEKFDLVKEALDNEIAIEKSKIEVLENDKRNSVEARTRKTEILNGFERKLIDISTKLESMKKEIKEE